MRTLTFAVLLLFAAGSAFAQTSYNVSVTAQRPSPTCSVSGTPSLNLGTITIPWTGSTQGNLQTGNVSISYTNTTSITATISKTNYSWDSGKITGSVFITDNNTATTGTGTVTKSVTGSSNPQTLTLYLRGRGTVNAGATPGTYNDNSGTISLTCTN